MTVSPAQAERATGTARDALWAEAGRLGAGLERPADSGEGARASPAAAGEKVLASGEAAARRRENRTGLGSG